MATYEESGTHEPLGLLSDMRVLGAVPTIGRALKGYDPSEKSYFLHKVPAARVMTLLSRIPAVVRAEFIRGFAINKQQAGLRLPKDVELVYSMYDVGKDRQLALVEYFGDERPDYLFLPQTHFLAFKGLRRGRKVGGPRGAARDPWGVVSRMAAYRKKQRFVALARGPKFVGPIQNAFGTTRVMRARARRQAPVMMSSPQQGASNAYAGHSALNRAAAKAYLRRARRRRPPVAAPEATATNRYVGPSQTTLQAASAFLARRMPTAMRLNGRSRRPGLRPLRS